jgi:hypothetical protein
MFQAVLRLWHPKEEQDDHDVQESSEQTVASGQDQDNGAARSSHDQLYALDVGDYA